MTCMIGINILYDLYVHKRIEILIEVNQTFCHFYMSFICKQHTKSTTCMMHFSKYIYKQRMQSCPKYLKSPIHIQTCLLLSPSVIHIT